MINRHKKTRTIATWQCILLLVAATWWLPSCTQERQPCLTPKIASLNLRFVHFATDTSILTNNYQDTALPSAVFGSLTGGATIHTLRYLSPSAYFTISLSSIADSCSWIFKADSLAANFDTLNFFYKRKLQFLSNACGYTNFYTLDSVLASKSSGNIDSILITSNSVTNDVNTRQLKIYMHPGF